MQVLTLNTFLLDVRLFGRLPLYPPAPHVAPRLSALPGALGETGADVICLQEVFRHPHRQFIARELAGAYPHHAGIRHIPACRWARGFLCCHAIPSPGPVPMNSGFPIWSKS
ncbi:MAG: hypothetical protein QF386_04390 [Alphaproteobacteria bacterium]|nr:hypothetical protein [Alphaproteobacteria bacterium]MDP6661281.1 hypothetical protein [Alphaproteobacteria bacterium]MDP6780280.1 hypothetical protein [Alphaproteobacteria bacterium]MDP7044847.1 hypothetical protein [Alphaproteobacteria bacterium]